MRKINNTRVKTKRASLYISALLHIKRLQVFFVFILVLLIFLYLYFLFASIYSTALRKDYQRKISKLNSNIAELEYEYFKLYDEIANSDFSELGYYKLSDSDKAFAKKSKYLGQAR